MIKKIYVKHQHRYTLEEADLFRGEATFNIYDDYEELVYQEEDNSKVRVCLYPDYIVIIRHGEIVSNLMFVENKKTKNILKSPYGDIEIELYTYVCQRTKGHIVVEYDILSSSEENDGYRIEFEVEEDVREYN